LETPSSGESEPIKPIILDRKKIAAMDGGNDALANRILEKYDQSSGTEVEKMAKAIRSNDQSGLCEAAHQLKGSSAYLKVDALDGLIVPLEQAARDGDWDTVHQLFPEFKKAHREVLAQIAALDLSARKP